MHEILTIQSGTRANFLATHFWNTQLSYQTPDPSYSPINHHILFRQGVSSQGHETFLPRTLIYDLKPAFGSLARVNAIDALLDDEHPSESELWQGPLKKLAGASFPSPAEPSPYAASLVAGVEQPVKPSRSTTRFFADFASGFFHPRGLHPLNPPYPSTSVSSSASPSSSSPQFSSFAHGAELFAALDADDEVLDAHVRPWMEEADAPQGVQFISSTHDAWGGFAARYLERLRDEYPKLSIWVWGPDDAGGMMGAGMGGRKGWARIGQRERERATNMGLALAEITALGSLFVPLGVAELPPDVVVQKGSLWEESALLCAGMESVGLAGRMRPGGDGARAPVMGDWEDVLCDAGRRRIGALRMGIGRRHTESGEKGDVRMGNGGMRLTGEVEDREEAEERLEKGLDVNLSPLEAPGPGNRERFLGKPDKTFSRIDAFRDNNGAGLVSSRDGRMPWRGGHVIEEYDTQPSFPLLETFPEIFERASDSKSLPVHSSLATSSSIATWIRTVQRSVSASIGLVGDLGGEEREALSHNLAEIREAYVEGWESGSDDDEVDDD